MKEHPPFAVLFDMDGVLIDSVGLNWQAYNEVLTKQYGFRVPVADISNYVGRTLTDQISLLSEHYHVAIDTEPFIHESDRIKQRLFATLEPKPGVVALLKELQAAAIPRAVGTSMSLATTKARLTTAGLWQYFDAIVTEEDTKRHKPHPEVFLKAAAKLRVDPAQCIVFEDAPAGVEAAKSGGMMCIAVTTPIVDRHDLSQADRVVNSLTTVNLPDLRSLAAT